MLKISPATDQDWPEMWPIFKDIVAKGDTYVYDPNISEKDAKIVWFASNFYTYVAREGKEIAGACVIRPNHRDLGSHIANAAFIVSPKFRGKGYGRQLGEYALADAKNHGYLAMQFNYVISTNKLAIQLWESLGFKIIGTVPEAHDHPVLGKLVDIHIMHRKL